MKITEEQLSLDKEIGKGAFGTVWIGSFLGTPIACKKLSADHHSTMDYNHEIDHEITLLKKLRHPNIITLIGVINKEKEKEILIIEELGENGSLYSWLHKDHKPIPFEVKLQWSVELCRALLYMHNKSIIHRDLKSENILLDKNRIVKICDFGLARKILKVTNSNGSSSNNNGGGGGNDSGRAELLLSKGVGTLWWRAPEIDLHPTYSNKVDIFSMGMIFAEMITEMSGDEIRCEIFAGSGDDFSSISSNLLEQFLKANALPQCPPDFIQLTVNCCRNDPNERPDLEVVLNQLSEMIDRIDQLSKKVKEVIPDPELSESFLALLRTSDNPENLKIQLNQLLSQLLPLSIGDRIISDSELQFVRSFFETKCLDEIDNVTPELYLSAHTWAKNLLKVLDDSSVSPCWSEGYIKGLIEKDEATSLLSPGQCIFRFRTPFEVGIVATYKSIKDGKTYNRIVKHNNIFLILDKYKSEITHIYPDIDINSEKLKKIEDSIMEESYGMDAQ